jgi:endonuclease/exonuclease/phosphatase family metal-dependent hydrolase
MTAARARARPRTLPVVATHALILTASSLPASAGVRHRVAPAPVSLRFMTYNIEYGGTVIDFGQIVKGLVRAAPDVVGVNEAFAHLRRLAAEVGYPYVSTRLDLISKYPLIDPPDGNGRYVFVQTVPGEVVAVSNVHLPSPNYGPRRLLDGWSRRKVLRNERASRLPAIRPFVHALAPVAVAGIPSVILGDFNAPSSQDWTAATVGVRPQNRFPVTWPVSRYLLGHGYADSYRQVHPDPVASPGLTWPSGRPPSPDSWNPRRDAPQDRIDQIWVAGPASATGIEIVGERGGPEVSIGLRPWGTDHRAVVSTLDATPGAPPVMGSPVPRLVDVGADLTVLYHAPGAAGERVVLVPEGGDPATDALDAAPTPGGQPNDGSLMLPTSSLPVGSYDAVLADAADAVLSRAPFWIRDPGSPPTLATAKHRYAVGEPLGFSWTQAPGNRFDWIGVYPRDADPASGSYAGYVYTRATVVGSAVFDHRAVHRWPLSPGRYTAYYLTTDIYRAVASVDFVVRG